MKYGRKVFPAIGFLLIAAGIAIAGLSGGTTPSGKGAAQTVLISGESGALSTRFDMEGNAYGPADYAVEGNRAALLNTATNTVYCYQDNQLTNQIDLDGFDTFGLRLYMENEEIYVMSGASMIKFTEAGAVFLGDIGRAMQTPGIFYFQVVGKSVYVRASTVGGNVTYLFEPSPETETLEKVKTIKGYMVDEDTFYVSSLIPEEGRIFGHGCEISILNQDGDAIDRVELSSEQYIIGAQYFGKDAAGNYIVLQMEMPPEGQEIETTLRTVSPSGEVITCTEAPADVFSMLCQVKRIDGTLYQFELDGDAASIAPIMDVLVGRT